LQAYGHGCQPSRTLLTGRAILHAACKICAKPRQESSTEAGPRVFLV